jgi:CBS domain-containing protein
MQHHLKDVMSRDVKVIGPEMTIREAARMMFDGDFGMMQSRESCGETQGQDRLIRQICSPAIVCVQAERIAGPSA